MNVPALALVLLPLGFALLAFLVPDNRRRPLLLPVAACCQLGALLLQPAGAPGIFGGWLVLDPLARLVLLTIDLLFLFCALYAPGYLRVRSDRRNRVFCGGLLAMVAMLTIVAMAHHLGLLWVALEATTLASAPLLYFNQTPRSLEAAWKFLLICSVGIALALLGSFFLAYSAMGTGNQTPTLLFDDLVASARTLSRPWLHAAFVTLLVGYGTKMGLAPMHTWKPDAYGEAPGVVGAMLAGGVTSGAFVAILRLLTIARAAGEDGFARPILVFMGLLSMTFAAVFMVRQKDIKRMLAYSSVEHMGILVLGAGLGGLALFGALLHLLNNALTKGVLFLSSGNIHRAFGSKSTDDVTGALGRVPLSAGLFLAGFLAITGSPPFGPFVSEFTIARAAFGSSHFVAAGLFLLLLMAVFLGMGSTVLAVVQGETPPPDDRTAAHVDRASLVLPIFGLMALVLVLGLWLPDFLQDLLQAAAAGVEGGP
jgi:hydrogenase-4 component F